MNTDKTIKPDDNYKTTNTHEIGCQTQLQVTPHLLKEGDTAHVISDAGCQTQVTLNPTSTNADAVPLLSFTSPREIKKDAVRQIYLPKTQRLQFNLPNGQEESVMSTDETISSYEGFEGMEGFAENDQEELIDVMSSDSISPRQHTSAPPVATGLPKTSTSSIRPKSDVIIGTNSYIEARRMSAEYKKGILVVDSKTRMIDVDCQTNLMVSPHLLSRQTKATVTSNISAQTSITCYPQSSVTEVIPKLTAFVNHSPDDKLREQEDLEETSIMELIKDIIIDVEDTHAHLFDSNYVPGKTGTSGANKDSDGIFFSNLLESIISAAIGEPKELDGMECLCKSNGFNVKIYFNDITGACLQFNITQAPDEVPELFTCTDLELYQDRTSMEETGVKIQTCSPNCISVVVQELPKSDHLPIGNVDEKKVAFADKTTCVCNQKPETDEVNNQFDVETMPYSELDGKSSTSKHTCLCISTDNVPVSARSDKSGPCPLLGNIMSDEEYETCSEGPCTARSKCETKRWDSLTIPETNPDGSKKKCIDCAKKKSKQRIQEAQLQWDSVALGSQVDIQKMDLKVEPCDCKKQKHPEIIEETKTLQKPSEIIEAPKPLQKQPKIIEETKLFQETSKMSTCIKTNYVSIAPKTQSSKGSRFTDFDETRSTASTISLKPDPVIVAMQACEAEFKPIKDAFFQVERKLRSLNWPELDCLFKREKSSFSLPKKTIYSSKLYFNRCNYPTHTQTYFLPLKQTRPYNPAVSSYRRDAPPYDSMFCNRPPSRNQSKLKFIASDLESRVSASSSVHHSRKKRRCKGSDTGSSTSRSPSRNRRVCKCCKCPKKKKKDRSSSCRGTTYIEPRKHSRKTQKSRSPSGCSTPRTGSRNITRKPQKSRSPSGCSTHRAGSRKISRKKQKSRSPSSCSISHTGSRKNSRKKPKSRSPSSCSISRTGSRKLLLKKLNSISPSSCSISRNSARKHLLLQMPKSRSPSRCSISSRNSLRKLLLLQLPKSKSPSSCSISRTGSRKKISRKTQKSRSASSCSIARTGSKKFSRRMQKSRSASGCSIPRTDSSKITQRTQESRSPTSRVPPRTDSSKILRKTQKSKSRSPRNKCIVLDIDDNDNCPLIEISKCVIEQHMKKSRRHCKNNVKHNRFH